jgi:receptor expression-enhancing protein 5/6
MTHRFSLLRSCLLSPLSFAARLKEVEAKTGYPAAWFFLAGCLLLSGLLTLVGGSKLIVDLLGFVYPAYQSFKSIDAGSLDDTQWLTYWVVFSFLSIMESIFGFIVNFIPFYFWLKIAIIVVRSIRPFGAWCTSAV